MYSVERNIFRCPILSINDSEAYYPEPSEERQFLMSLQCKNDPLKNHVFGDVRLNTVGESYIEILIYYEETSEKKESHATRENS